MAALVAEKVTTVVPLPGAVRLAFENAAVTPVGSPVQLSATAELKAPESALDKLTWTLEPAFRVRLVCAEVRAKLGGAIKVRGTVIV